MNRIRPVNSTDVRDLVSRFQPTSPQEVTQLIMRLAAVAAGAAYGLAAHSLPAGVLVAGLLVLPLEAARRWRIHRLTTSLFERIIKLVRADEYEGDRAQDRRLVRRMLRGDFTAGLFATHHEEARATVRASKYVRLRVLGGGVLPTVADVTEVRVRWAPYVVINKGAVKGDILSQVGAWFGTDCEVVGGWREGWNTRACHVWITRKADADLPTQVAYPGSADDTPRFTQPLTDEEGDQ